MSLYVFVVPLLIGFALAGASAFTAAYSQRWGERGCRLATSILRNFLGILCGSSAAFSLSKEALMNTVGILVLEELSP